MSSRRNAMLTTEDRRWLTGEKEYEGVHAKQQRYQRRRDIHERVYNSILDWTILFDHLEERQRTRLFEDVKTAPGERPENDELLEDDEAPEHDDSSANDESPGDDEFSAGLRDALAFVLYNTGIVDAMGDGGGAHETPAERLLFEAIYRAGSRDGILVEDVDLEIVAVDRPLTAVLEDLERGRDLSPAELRLLLESDEVETARVQECVRELVMGGRSGNDEVTNERVESEDGGGSGGTSESKDEVESEGRDESGGGTDR